MDYSGIDYSGDTLILVLAILELPFSELASR
jgi:hypothetical protein